MKTSIHDLTQGEQEKEQQEIVVNFTQLEKKLKSELRNFPVTKYFDLSFSSDYEEPIKVTYGQYSKPNLIINLPLLVSIYELEPQDFVVMVLLHIERYYEFVILEKNKVRSIYLQERNEHYDAIEEHLRSGAQRLEFVLRTIFSIQQFTNNSTTLLLRESLGKLYSEKIYAERDLLGKPKHIQFLHALLIERLEGRKWFQKYTRGLGKDIENEENDGDKEEEGSTLLKKEKSKNIFYTLVTHFIPNYEVCDVDRDVRKYLRKIRNLELLGQSHLDKSIKTSKPLDQRMSYSWKHIEPLYMKLLIDDYSASKEMIDTGKFDSLVQSNEEEVTTDTNEKTLPTIEHQKQFDETGGRRTLQVDANQRFGHYYDKYSLPLRVEDYIPKGIEEDIISKALLAEHAKRKRKNQTINDLYLQERVSEMMAGSDRTDMDYEGALRSLKEYDVFVKDLFEVIDNETGLMLIDLLKELFLKIKSRRLGYTSRKTIGPVGLDRGQRLYEVAIAQGIADIISGNSDPQMFEYDHRAEKIEERTGNFHLSLIGDGSGSMNFHQVREQRKMIFAGLEGLKRIHDDLSFENLKIPINFTSSAYLFYGGNDILVVKRPSSDLTDKERLYAFSALSNCTGGTDDYAAVNLKRREILAKGGEHIEGLRSGLVKEIVVVSTDGLSGNQDKLTTELTQIRNLGVIVYAIGFSNAARKVAEAYHTPEHGSELGFGVYIEDVTDLGSTFWDMLIPHLENL